MSRRGVHPTPSPLADWVVRSLHRLLQDRFGFEDGLADPRVRLLDPAAGPLNFIFAAWELALEHQRSLGGDPASLLRDHLVPHSRGIEALADACSAGRAALREFLSPYLPFGSTERRLLVCGDALAGPGIGDLVAGGLPVVLGNPPWIGFTPHRGAWISALLRGYRLPNGRVDRGCYQVDGLPLGERNPKWIQDDCVKFLRLAQWVVDLHGSGIVAFVINHNVLDAPTLRGFRFSLLRAFEEVRALDLHGNGRKADVGSGDQNVFSGVRQGCAVLLLVKQPGLERRVYRADLGGSRASKFEALQGHLADLPWTELRPRAPLFLLAPPADEQLEREYLRGIPLDQIFPRYASGLITGNDALWTAIDRRTLELRLRDAGRLDWLSHLTVYLARPFDLRYILYLPEILARPRRSIMRHLRMPNLALVVPRLQKDAGAALVTAWVTGHKAASHYDASSLFPLFLYSGSDPLPNVSVRLLDSLGELYGRHIQPEDLLAYVYAVLQTPLYTKRYEQLLSQGFPRVPFPRGYDRFERLALRGRELVRLHLFRDDRLSRSLLPLAGDSSRPLANCSYAADSQTLVLNTQGLRLTGVAPDVWSYRVGGYAVVSRWLSARRGRVLETRELRELAAVLAALQLTLKIQSHLDFLFRCAQDDGVARFHDTH